MCKLYQTFLKLINVELFPLFKLIQLQQSLTGLPMFSRLISYLSIALCSFYLTACSGPETAQDVSVTFVRSAYTADVKKTLDCIDFSSADKEDDRRS